MAAYLGSDAGQLRKELDSLLIRYEGFKLRGLKLNMSRGKPSPEQLDLSNALLDTVPSSERPLDSSGEDTRNYGLLLGIPEARLLFGQILCAPASEVLVSGNSSLALMHDTIMRSMLFGVRGSKPWCTLDTVKFLCPSPGYDRHFAITASQGIENIEIAMAPDGPDMDAVRYYAEGDPAVKGIWCVPKFSNPEGVVYSNDVVCQFAALKPAAGDFRIFWDNAYAVHGLTEPAIALLNLRDACIQAGSPDLYYMFASTSKITFATGGLSALSTSPDNLAEIEKLINLQNIGPDKINQLRHVRFLRDLDGVKAHMRRQAAIIAPKFAVVLDTLERELGGLGIAEWTKPLGGYFISFDGLDGTALRTVKLAKEAGVVLTEAGATYPYGRDKRDRNIRIAPTYPPIEELAIASELFCVCVKIAAVEKLLE